ncbi:transaldolase/EF-hand domain-containing protein [Roseovarius sp. THAF9]|uniref:EF-hand domain-containing protein n=1 Tax=Roseovarius sp. THAF9 TaxID=2587847 RepID=UPI0012AA065B|nr:EF-hand domain-containing protein [Roseovarius sp. THAF9]QFT93795.1 transaldolase/EF-hand domain-containing protein [Roseovarius sp. THAF9]
MKNLMIMSALGMSIALGGAVQGQAASDEGKGPRHSFEDLDANGDGQLTREEMQAHMKARFDAADTDGDGVMSLEEMQARGQERAAKRAGKMIERLDTDGDGGVSFEEAQARRGGKMFDRADADGDGAISKAEFDTAREKMREMRAKHHGKKKEQNAE